MLNMKVLSRNGLLYPMLLIAAISVILFSALGVATMTGLLPRAESMSDARPAAQTGSRNETRPVPPAASPDDASPSAPADNRGG
jgi:hypothetical protein